MRGAVLMPQSNDNGKNLENTVFMQLNRMRLPSDQAFDFPFSRTRIHHIPSDLYELYHVILPLKHKIALTISLMVKEQKSLDKYYCIDNGMRGAVLMPQSNDNGKNLELYSSIYQAISVPLPANGRIWRFVRT